jgi:hypothetical protein
MATTETTVQKFYRLHGIQFDINSNQEGITECPFCSKRKFYASLKEGDGRWCCHACQISGNPQTFLEHLHKVSMEHTTDYSWIENHRRISRDVLRKWGVCLSVTTQDWIIPAYYTSGRIGNIYRFVKVPDSEKYRLIGSVGLTHGIFGLHLLDESTDSIDFCEGPWDAMAWKAKSKRQVLGIPGCNVFNDSWKELCRDRTITFLYDNDYPRKNGQMPGFDGMRNASQKLLDDPDNRPKEVRYLHWGDKGYTSDFPDGFDIRDILLSKNITADKTQFVLDMVRTVPKEWQVQEGKLAEIEPLECTSWEQLREAWKKAVHFNQGMERAILCSLASITSVPFSTIGDEQVWMKIIAPPSSGKTLICETLATDTKHVVSRSSFNGFYSGYKTDKYGLEDHSLVVRLNNKTLVTKDGDTLLQSENLREILSQARDIYDGTSRKEYKNAIRREYQTRMSWLIFGTPALRGLDQSELGCRFLDLVMIDRIDLDTEKQMTRRAIRQQLKNLGSMSNCRPESNTDENYLLVKRLTRGYLEFLFKEAPDKVPQIDIENEEIIQQINSLALFVAYLRARPSLERKHEDSPTRELSMRVSKQLTKLAGFLAFVMNKTLIDQEVIAIVRQVAQDTARGRTFEIIKAMRRIGKEACSSEEIAAQTAQGEVEERKYLKFLTRIFVLQVTKEGDWKLHPDFQELLNSLETSQPLFATN